MYYFTWIVLWGILKKKIIDLKICFYCISHKLIHSNTRKYWEKAVYFFFPLPTALRHSNWHADIFCPTQLCWTAQYVILSFPSNMFKTKLPMEYNKQPRLPMLVCLQAELHWYIEVLQQNHPPALSLSTGNWRLQESWWVTFVILITPRNIREVPPTPPRHKRLGPLNFSKEGDYLWVTTPRGL